MIPGQVDEFGDIDEVDEVVAEGGWCVPVTDHLVEAQKAHWDAFMALATDVGESRIRYEPDEDVSLGQTSPPPDGSPVAPNRAHAPLMVVANCSWVAVKVKLPLVSVVR